MSQNSVRIIGARGTLRLSQHRSYPGHLDPANPHQRHLEIWM